MKKLKPLTKKEVVRYKDKDLQRAFDKKETLLGTQNNPPQTDDNVVRIEMALHKCERSGFFDK